MDPARSRSLLQSPLFIQGTVSREHDDGDAVAVVVEWLMTMVVVRLKIKNKMWSCFKRLCSRVDYGESEKNNTVRNTAVTSTTAPPRATQKRVSAVTLGVRTIPFRRWLVESQVSHVCVKNASKIFA